MADAKVSALAAVSTLADADVLAIVNAASLKKVSLTQLTAYFEQRSRQNNASVANQSVGAADTYLTGSDVLIPDGRGQAKAKYNLRIAISKTAAGTGTPTLNIRVGTAGTTADTSRCLFTFPAANTAAADTAWFEAMLTFRTFGSGTSTVLQGALKIEHQLTATGFGGTSQGANMFVNTTGGGFDGTVPNLRIGASLNGSTGAVWTVTQVDAVLSNLA